MPYFMTPSSNICTYVFFLHLIKMSWAHKESFDYIFSVNHCSKDTTENSKNRLFFPLQDENEWKTCKML